MPAPPAVVDEVYPGERADRAAEPDDLVTQPGGGEGLADLAADLGAQRAQLARLRRIGADEPPRHAYGAQGNASRPRDPAPAHGREL
jgi:hypothetical protein